MYSTQMKTYTVKLVSNHPLGKLPAKRVSIDGVTYPVPSGMGLKALKYALTCGLGSTSVLELVDKAWQLSAGTPSVLPTVTAELPTETTTNRTASDLFKKQLELAVNDL